MAKLYIANTLKQTQIIFYRMDIDPDGGPNALRRFQPAKQSPAIPKGRQIVLGGDLELHQIDNIVTQLSRVGLVAEKDVGRLSGSVPYIFNIDQPVRAESIRQVLAHNAGVLIGQGKTRREAAAIAARASLESQAQEARIEPQLYEASIEQEEVSENDEKSIDEGYRVAKTVSDVPEARRSRGRPRKAVA
jgi:hypothetical protein